MSNSEEIVMNVFWQTPEPLTVSQLSRLLEGQDWSKNYIHKVLRWLSGKEFIKVVGIAQEGRYQAQQYVPTLTKDEYLAYMLEEQGVEIRTCGTCLNFYGISDKKPYLYEVIKFRASISQRLLPVFLLPIY